MLKEKLYDNGAKRIRLSVWKADNRPALVMHLQEYDVDPTDPTVESFVLFGSWSVTVARDACPRATKTALQRFYDAHIAEARERVAARVAVLEAGAA